MIEEEAAQEAVDALVAADIIKQEADLEAEAAALDGDDELTDYADVEVVED